MRRIIAALWILVAFAALPERVAPAPTPRPAPAALAAPLKAPRIVVHKKQRTLVLHDGSAVIRTFKVGLGFNPVDDKVKSGDGCTPEGEYRVCIKNPHSQFYRALAINYPNSKDAERGLRDRLITRDQYRRVLAADREKRTPPWDTRLGGNICIHGCGASSDWTLGCVALESEDMQVLYDSVRVGTPVTILHE